jgi:hypothetical protein
MRRSFPYPAASVCQRNDPRGFLHQKENEMNTPESSENTTAVEQALARLAVKFPDVPMEELKRDFALAIVEVAAYQAAARVFGNVRNGKGDC